VTRAGRPLVLCYHGVSETAPHPLLVPAREIERQVAFLVHRGYRPAPAAEVVTGRGRLLHVTFDDAYENVLDVLPALERLRARATVFACSDLADDGTPPSLLEVDDSLEAGFATLRWDRLRELVERGVGVASHTASHPHLTELSPEDLRHELVESRERLEGELGRRCSLLAYPFGDNDERVRAAARSAGYEAAFGLPGDMSWSDPFNIPRTGIWHGEGLLRVAMKTSRAVRTNLVYRLLGKGGEESASE
jgi:peptidoglycan/xylan/chitin deacetylase (PgdA/CDA1 family)